MACDTEQERLLSILSLLQEKRPISYEVLAEFVALAGDASNLIGLDHHTLDTLMASFEGANGMLRRREHLRRLMEELPEDGNVDDVDEGAELLSFADDETFILMLPNAERAALEQRAMAVRKYVIHF